jgi:hypothetical protein
MYSSMNILRHGHKQKKRRKRGKKKEEEKSKKTIIRWRLSQISPSSISPSSLTTSPSGSSSPLQQEMRKRESERVE